MKTTNLIFIFISLYSYAFSYRILDTIKGGYNYIIGYYNGFYMGISYNNYFYDTNTYTLKKMSNLGNSYLLLMNYVYPSQLLGAKDSSLIVATINNYFNNEFTENFPYINKQFNQNIKNVFKFSKADIHTENDYNNLIVWTENNIYYLEPISDYQYNVCYTFPFDSKDYIKSVLVTENNKEKLVLVLSKRDNKHKLTFFTKGSSSSFSNYREYDVTDFQSDNGKLFEIGTKGHYVVLVSSNHFYVYNLDGFGWFKFTDNIEEGIFPSDFGYFDDGVSLKDGDVFLSYYDKKISIEYRISEKKIYKLIYTDLLYDKTCENLAQTYDENHGVIAMSCGAETYFIDLYNERTAKKASIISSGSNKITIGLISWVVIMILGNII